MLETELQFTFYKVGPDGTAKSVRPYYDGPRNAILVLGIPKTSSNHVRVAYATMGSSTYHAHLEPVASPRGFHDGIKAELSSIPRGDGARRELLLGIYVLPAQDRARMETVGLNHSDAFALLPETMLDTLQRKLGAARYYFIEDTRWRKAIDEAQMRELATMPKCGLPRLQWHQARFTSE